MDDIDLYCLTDVSEPPQKMDCMQNGFFFFVPPPLPEVLIIFAAPPPSGSAKPKPITYNISMEIDVGVTKSIGDLCVGHNNANVFLWHTKWAAKDVKAANQVGEVNGLLTLRVLDKSAKLLPLLKSEAAQSVREDGVSDEADEGIGSQDLDAPNDDDIFTSPKIKANSSKPKAVARSIRKYFKKEELKKEPLTEIDDSMRNIQATLKDSDHLIEDIRRKNAEVDTVMAVELTKTENAESECDPFDDLFDTMNTTEPKTPKLLKRGGMFRNTTSSKKTKFNENNSSEAGCLSDTPSATPANTPCNTPATPVTTNRASTILKSLAKDSSASSPRASSRQKIAVTPLQYQSPKPTARQLHKPPSKSMPCFSDLLHTNGPSGRWGHKFCSIESNKVVLIGGQGKGQQFAPDSMWQYDIVSQQWAKQSTDNPTTERRIGHSAVFDAEKRIIYIFGGSKHKKWFNDVHRLNVDTWKWDHIETVGKAPTRAYHSCTQFYQELLIFGGVFPNPDPTPDGCSDKLMIFDTEQKSWYEPIMSGDRPSARSGHTADLIDSKLFIFAGWDAPECFNDIFSLDLGIMRFNHLSCTGSSPSKRTWHSSTVFSDQTRIMYYGGFDGDQALNDMFLFDTASSTWSQLNNTTTEIGRAGHSSIMITRYKNLDDSTTVDEEDGQQMIIFGGGNNQGGFFNDLFELNETQLETT